VALCPEAPPMGHVALLPKWKSWVAPLLKQSSNGAHEPKSV